MRIDRRLPAVAGELPGKAFNDLGRDAADAGIIGNGFCEGAFLEKIERGLQPQRRFAHGHLGIDEQFCRAGRLFVRNETAGAALDHDIGVLVRIFLPLDRQADIRAAQMETVAGMSSLGDDQMRRVAPGGQAGGRRQLAVGLTQILRVITLVLDDPADHRHGEGAIRCRADRNPAALVSSGHGIGMTDDRIDHHIVELAAAAAFGELEALPFERVAGVGGRCAAEDHELRVGEVRLGMRHLLEITKCCTRARAVRAAAIAAMAGHVDRAEGLLDKPAQEILPPLIGRGQAGELVSSRPQFRPGRIDRLHRADCAQAFDFPLAEQVAALDDLLDELLERDRLPFTRAARADAFQRLENTIRAGHLGQHRRAAPAGRRTAFVTLLGCARHCDETVADRHLRGKDRIGR